jgi:outer membrane protein assembly factor BamD
VDPSADARKLFERASSSMRSGNWEGAISNYEGLTAVYPFSEFSKQAQLDLMYAYWRNDEPESAVDAADQFVLENPTHPRVDYALYIKGLAWVPRERGPMEKLFRVDLARRPPGELMQSFNAFSRLAQEHPDSPYTPDARQRMVFLRNRLASYEIHVADYYLRRSEWIAAANRARYVVENYQETPSVVDALQIMVKAYRELDLAVLASDSMRVLAENYPAEAHPWGERLPKLKDPGMERSTGHQTLR